MIAAWFNEDDRDLMKRITGVLAFVLVFTASFCHLQRTYERKFFDVTGEAKWIWAQHPLNANAPLAFFAAREFSLPEKRAITHLKILADPEYTIYVNGQPVISRRAGDGKRSLDVIDLAPIVKTGRNRIVVAVRAPQGFGGLIASIDLAAENAAWLVTDERWNIYRRWDPAILTRDLPAEAQRPMVIGEPPVGQWDFLPQRGVQPDPVVAEVLAPSREFQAIGQLPAIRNTNGIAVAGVDRATATVFDFGPVKGRLRLTLGRPSFASRTVQVRFANDTREISGLSWNLRPIVFAPGEQTVTAANQETFRYAVVFGRNVRAKVMR